VIDTRNGYEISVGSFERAIDPGTRSFRDFPAWFDDFAEKLREQGRKPRIAMFCTGGIRCEKSTALVRTRGFEEVITCAAAYCAIWRKCRKRKACGAATAMSSMSGWQWAMG